MILNNKIKEWVEMYLEHIQEITPEVHVRDEEGYKFKSVETFQKNFDITAEDFTGMLERAIEHNNLMAGSMYLPRRMILIFAQEHEEECRQVFKMLFDEKITVAARLNGALDKFDTIMEKRNRAMNESAHSWIGLRALSVLLGYRFPETCNPIKPREWKVFCKFINNEFNIPNHTSIGEQYEVFFEHIEALRKYIQNIPQIKSLHGQLTRGLEFDDKYFRWMTQDVIYVTARVFAGKKSDEKPVLKESVAEDEESKEVVLPAGMEFPVEKYLEEFMVKNWDSIDFGEPLELFIDEDGTLGQQYVTDVGIIDILAKDNNGDFVVLELKKGAYDQRVIGQILAYIHWVKENLASANQKVWGIVIVGDGNQALFAAQQEVADRVKVKYYKVKLDIVDPNQ